MEKMIDISHLCKADLYLFYKKAIKSGSFEGSFKTFRELTNRGGFELEQNNLRGR
jgi:hypothetical protein